MTDIDEQASQHKPVVSIYHDLQNVHLTEEQANLLLAFANSKGDLGDKKVYYNSLVKDQASAKNDQSNLGYNCRDVPCSLKNSADNQLIADCIRDIHSNLSPNIVILLSGDRDFVELVCTLQQLGKKVIILAKRGNVKQKLKEIADEFYFVDDLLKLVEDKVQHQIDYNEAIEYLVKAIKTALSQGKKDIEFPAIDRLMRKLFPTYKGASSILKKDGKPFSQFGKFVAAAVADGKVRVQTTGKNQKLLLI